MRISNCILNFFIFNVLIGMYGKNKNFSEMMVIFEDM